MGKAMKVCSQPGCHILTRDTRCAEHTRARDKARGRRQARGYGQAHDQLRATWQARLDAGERVTCWRCAEAGTPHTVDPTCWDLGHDDRDRNIYRGPECRGGNRATSGRMHRPA